MDINRLEEFMVIAQERSIKKAAQKLSLSPATLSSRLSAFESELGVQLFARSRSALTLTDAGTRLCRNAEEILSEYHHIAHEMEIVSSNELHSLRIGIIGNEMPFHLGPYLDIVNLRNPHVRIELLDEQSFSITEGLLSGDIDLCLGPMMTTFHHEDIICQTIAPPHSSVILPLTHPLAYADSVSLSQLNRETFILTPACRCPAVREFQLANIRAALTHYEFYESETSSQFAAYLVPVGKGLLLSPFHDPIHLPRCIRRPLTDLPHPAPDCILYLKKPYQKELRSFITDFMKFVRESDDTGHEVIL